MFKNMKYRGFDASFNDVSKHGEIIKLPLTSDSVPLATLDAWDEVHIRRIIDEELAICDPVYGVICVFREFDRNIDVYDDLRLRLFSVPWTEALTPAQCESLMQVYEAGVARGEQQGREAVQASLRKLLGLEGVAEC